MIEILKGLLHRNPNRLYQVTTWLGPKEDWGGRNRRFVALLTQAEIDQARKSFSEEKGKDNCWGDRAFSLFPNLFNPR